MKQLSAQDAQFLYMETESNLANATMVCIYKEADTKEGASGQTAFTKVISQLQNRLSCSPIFTRKLKRVPGNIDYPYWVKDNYFDLKAHLHHHILEAPGNWPQLTELIGRIHSQPLDMRRPLWEMHIVEGFDGSENCPKNGFALITKLHHAAIDGAAAMQFFAAMSDIDPQGKPALPQQDAATNASLMMPSHFDMLSTSVSNHLVSPAKFTKTLAASTPALIKQHIRKKRAADYQPPEKVPTTLFNASVSPNKSFGAVKFSLEDLKSIQHKVVGAKLNDVVLAITAGAMVKYLSARNALPSESLVAWVPINARPSGKANADDEPGNNVTAMTTPLGTKLANPIERLEEITKNTQASKSSEDGMGARLVTDLSQHLPGISMAIASQLLLASGAAAKLCNVTVSNVPGHQKPMYLAGSQCVHQYGLVPLAEGMGLFVVALSNNGIMSFSVTSTKEIIPDMDEFCHYLEQSFQELFDK